MIKSDIHTDVQTCSTEEQDVFEYWSSLLRVDEGRTLAREPPVLAVGHSSQKCIVLVMMMVNSQQQKPHFAQTTN